MLVDSHAIAFDLEKKAAKGEMCISPDMESDDWIIAQYECDLVTYKVQAEYCDGYLMHGAAYICENVENVRYTITDKGSDVRSYDNIAYIIAEYVVQKINYLDTPDLYTYKGKGAA